MAFPRFQIPFLAEATPEDINRVIEAINRALYDIYHPAAVGLEKVTNVEQLRADQLVQSVGLPGSQDAIPSEAAVRAAIQTLQDLVTAVTTNINSSIDSGVLSVFNRKGIVAAQSGDYSADQVTDAVHVSGGKYQASGIYLGAAYGIDIVNISGTNYRLAKAP